MFEQERRRCLLRTVWCLSMRLTPGGTFRAWGGVAATQRDYESTSHEGMGQLVEPRASNKPIPLAMVPVVPVQMADIRP